MLVGINALLISSTNYAHHVPKPKSPGLFLETFQFLNSRFRFSQNASTLSVLFFFFFFKSFWHPKMRSLQQISSIHLSHMVMIHLTSGYHSQANGPIQRVHQENERFFMLAFQTSPFPLEHHANATGVAEWFPTSYSRGQGRLYVDQAVW